MLGPLETGPPQLRDTLRAYLAAGENVARAAEALKLHRNTVMRRLAQIEERLPRPAAENRAELAAALELLRWLPKAER